MVNKSTLRLGAIFLVSLDYSYGKGSILMSWLTSMVESVFSDELDFSYARDNFFMFLDLRQWLERESLSSFI